MSVYNIGVVASVMIASIIGTPAMAAQTPDINGGTSWTGWQSIGRSNSQGLYGSGDANALYEVYTTKFVFNNNSKSGSPVGGGPTGGATGFGTGSLTPGAFANGNTILGIGVRWISGGNIGTYVPTVKFDLAGDSYRPATTVGGTDGRTSFSAFSHTGDFTVQFNGSGNWRGSALTLQADNGLFAGGTNVTRQLVHNGDVAYRAFAATSSYQMFFDIDAMQALYGIPNPFNQNPNFNGIGQIRHPVTVALNGLGDNNTVFSLAVPEPQSWAMMLIGFSLIGLVTRRRAMSQLPA